MSAQQTDPLSHAERLALLLSEFERRFGTAPAVAARAPGRVDLMGSHTDYNEGWVLTMSIDRDTWVFARPRADRVLHLASLNADEEETVSLDALAPLAHTGWTAYPAGVAWVLQETGASLLGADILVHTTVPLGSGLSSSAALETATSVALEAMNGIDLGEVPRALLSQRAEREYVGVNCGILDQFTSSAAKAHSVLLLDCRIIEGKTVPMHDSLRVVICDTRAKRALASSQYGARRAACEEAAARLATLLPHVRTLRDVTSQHFAPLAKSLREEPAKRAKFIIEENERVLALTQALQENDRAAIGALTAASFAGARDLYEITVPEMERMIEAMLGAPGVIGARQAGAGFGGCMVAFVDAALVAPFSEHVAAVYLAATGIPPAIYPVEAAAGAGPLADFAPAI